MGSQIVAVRAGLLTGLTALAAYTTTGPTGQKPEVEFGWKVNWKRREKVWTQRARFTHAPASMRAAKTFTNEIGEFDLMIFVHGVGLTQQVTSTRAVSLGSAAWDWVQTHANWQALNLGLSEMLVDGGGELSEAVDGEGNALAEFRLPCKYKARLT